MLLALAALLVALLALSRASAALRSRDQVEAFIRDPQQTDIQVLFLKMDAGQYNFTLANRGGSAARQISLELLDDLAPEVDPLAGTGDQLPVRQIDPGGFFQIPVAVAAGTPRSFRVRVSWVNAGGLQSEKEVPLSLMD